MSKSKKSETEKSSRPAKERSTIKTSKFGGDNYEVESRDTEQFRLGIDPKVGGEEIIRRFTIVLPPSQIPVSKEEILAHQVKTINEMLYKDGWELKGDLKIEKKSAYTYYIFANAIPGYKRGMRQMVLDKTLSVQEALHGRAK